MASPPLPSAPGAIKRKRSDASDRSSPSYTDEVSADFRDALQELVGNDRYQISNLTVIAKESLTPDNLAQANQNALAICDVLVAHIAKVGPTRKLPALYVLDSIVKNVGNPYSGIFSRNLFKIFMDAYTLVDQGTRKHMENMLKTWKDSAPGLDENAAVFPHEVTRSIENALIRARTIVEQQKQQQQQQQQQHSSFPQQQQSQQHYPHGPPPASYYPPPSQYQAAPTQHIPGLVSPPPPSSFQPQAYQPPPQQYPHQSHTPQPYSKPAQSSSHYQQFQPAVPTPPLQPNSYNLGALLQATANIPHQQPHSPYTQSQQYPTPQQYPPPPLPTQPAVQFPGLEALFKHQKLPEYPAAGPQARLATPQPPSSSNTPAKSFLFTPPSKSATLASVPTLINNDATLTTASLKIHRPVLLATLYADRPRQCTTCGRRFAATEEGKDRKSRHLDAHFRTNRKFAQMEDDGGRGVNRSWYVGEVDWISAKEYDDADKADPNAQPGAHPSGGSGGGADPFNPGLGTGAPSAAGGPSASSQGKGPWGGSQSWSQSYIKAPVDAALVKYACPICQEEYKATWHDGIQEWVWMDTVRLGDKVYHESCLDEMARDRGVGKSGTTTGRTSTPLAGSGLHSKT